MVCFKNAEFVPVSADVISWTPFDKRTQLSLFILDGISSCSFIIILSIRLVIYNNSFKLKFRIHFFQFSISINQFGVAAQSFLFQFGNLYRNRSRYATSILGVGCSLSSSDFSSSADRRRLSPYLVCTRFFYTFHSYQRLNDSP